MNQQCKMSVLGDGTKVWTLNGALHREDGPAIEYTNGHKEWYQHGKRHREDGPAIIWSSGVKSFFLHDAYHTDIIAWAKNVLQLQNKEPTQEMFDAKIMQVMQADLFN